MIIVSCNGRGAACCARTDVLRAVGQEFRDRLADGLRQPVVVGAQPGEGVVGVDVELDPARHRNAAPDSGPTGLLVGIACQPGGERAAGARSEEHTSELQSPDHLVCRPLLELKNYTTPVIRAAQDGLLHRTVPGLVWPFFN